MTQPRPHKQFWPARVPESIHVPVTSLWHNLATSGQRYPDKAALVFFDRVTTYGELLAQTERLAAGLHALGVQAGDRVLRAASLRGQGARVADRLAHSVSAGGICAVPGCRNGQCTIEVDTSPWGIASDQDVHRFWVHASQLLDNAAR